MVINVLSLCDGMACLMESLYQMKIPVNKYYASEIYEPAKKISLKNHPNIIQVGDLRDIDTEFLKSLPKIHMLGFGFPCKGLSITNLKNYKQGLNEKQSNLFYNCYEILEWLRKNNNPNIKFLCENVESMNHSDKNIITESLGVSPIMIDAALVSAQNRKRYYWTNIEGIEQPKDKGVLLKDIVEYYNIPNKYWYKQEFDYHGDDKKVIATLHINGHDIIKRVYNINGKCATLTGVTGGNQQKKIYQNGKCRKLIPIEYERLQCIPYNYTEGVADGHRYNMLGNGWNIEVIKHILSYWNYKEEV